MKCIKHLIETDDSNDFIVQNDYFMISGSRDTIYNFSHGHVTLETIVKIEIENIVTLYNVGKLSSL